LPPLSARLALVLSAALALGGCRKKASAADCEALVRHFAEVTARERGVDGGAEIAEVVAAAKGDPEALSCSDEVEERQARCALAAATTEAILACLER